MRIARARRLSLLLAGAVALSLLVPGAASAKTLLDCSTIPLLTTKVIDDHFAYDTVTPELKKRFVSLYASQIDPTETLLTQGAFKKLTARVQKAFENTLRGNCVDLGALHADELKWQKAMEDFARKTLGAKGFKLNPQLELQLNADKRARAANQTGLDKLRSKLLQFQLAAYVTNGESLADAKKKLVHRYELITKRVSERTPVDLYSGFIKTFALALDPHTTYFSQEDLEDFRINMNLSLEGIGAVLSSRDGYTMVEKIVPGGAAARQGQLKVKDKIIAVAQGADGAAVNVIDMALSDVVRKIRGKKGTQVKLTVVRSGATTQTLSIVITRDKIDLAEQAAKLRWKNVERNGKKQKLAILELPSFYGGTSPGARDATRDVAKLLAEVKAKGADGLVLDLSGNGGGLLQGAVDISGFFIAQGPVVGVSDARSPSQVLADKNSDVAYSGPLVVLTSRLSASASEILAGALKDYKRAVIVGDGHTFGKGSVQSIVQLPPGMGALKVTSALFFRPGGQSTQNVGIGSDIVVPSPFALPDIGERHSKFALPTRTIKGFKGKLVNHTDPGARWTPVSDALLGRLSKASAKRIAAHPEFKKLSAKLKKDTKAAGMVKLSSLLDKKDKAGKGKDGKKPEAKDADKLSLQAEEALAVLADLVSDSRSTTAARP